MCGLVSVLAPRPIDPPRLIAALDALAARGPDGRGAWWSAERTVGLGHTRLAVIDPTGGAQPIASEDDDVHVAVNGELYGFEEQRRALEARGHHFRTGSDSEVALHLYQEYGDGFLAHLRGEFALVLWDARRRRLLAARDRFGIKPLVYAEHDGEVWIASQAKALFAAGVPAAWDYPALWHALSLQYPPPGRTLFRGVAALEPGCYLVAEDGAVTVGRYWDLDLPVEPAGAEDDEIAALLADAVAVRLRADVPVACHVSGGLDSSLVLALSGLDRCFTVGFEGGGAYDEQALAAATADACGARLDPLRLGADELAEHLADAVYACEGLAINAHLSAKYLLSRRVRAAGVRAVLTGEGADELFGGYPWYAADHGLDVDGGVSRGIMTTDGARVPLARARARLGFVPAFLAAKAALGTRVRALVSPDASAEVDPAAAVDALLDAVPAAQLAGRSPAQVSTYLWCKTALADYILRTLGDGAELAHGVEGRLPFLDHRLFERARELAPADHVAGGASKAVLRRIARGRVPDAVLTRAKHPFYAPPIADHPALRARIDRRLFAIPGAAREPGDDAARMLALTASLLGERFGL